MENKEGIEEKTAEVSAGVYKEDIEAKLKLNNKVISGANWFYWIAALSLVNTVIFLFGGNWTFVIGLGITQITDGIALEVQTGGRIIAFIVNVIIAGIFAGFGFLSRKRYTWAFITGMVLYAADGLLFILVQDVLSIIFHAIALFFMFGGLRAHFALKQYEKTAQST
jgi:hypothetical protein